MASLAFELSLRFLWGASFLLLFVDRKESSERFLRIATGILWGVAGFALAVGWQLPSASAWSNSSNLIHHGSG